MSYNSSDNTYLLAYGSYTGTNGLAGWVYVQAMSASGSLSGTAQAISTAGSEQSAPAIAYDSDNHHFFAVWQDGRSSSFDIYGRFLGSNGVPSGSELALEADWNDQTDREGQWVGSAQGFLSPGSDDIYEVRVGYHQAVGQYLIAWVDHNYGDTVIYGQRVASD